MFFKYLKKKCVGSVALSGGHPEAENRAQCIDKARFVSGATKPIYGERSQRQTSDKDIRTST